MSLLAARLRVCDRAETNTTEEKTMKLQKIILGSCVSGALWLGGAPAQATLIFRISDGTTTISISDGSAGDSDPTAGAISFNGPIGNTWNVNVSTAIGTAQHSGGFGINLSSASTSNGAGTLSLAMTETGLIWGGPGLTSAQVSGAISGATAGTASYRLFTDNTNAPLGQGTAVFTGTTSNPTFSGNGGGPVDLADPFSMSLFMNIVHAGPGATSFNFDSTVSSARVPEPAALGLMGLGLLGLGFTRVPARR